MAALYPYALQQHNIFSILFCKNIGQRQKMNVNRPLDIGYDSFFVSSHPILKSFPYKTVNVTILYRKIYSL